MASGAVGWHVRHVAYESADDAYPGDDDDDDDGDGLLLSLSESTIA